MKRKIRLRKAWIKRYAVLEGNKLSFFEDDKKSQYIKTIDLSKIKTVVFHYDESAPVQSKNMNK